MARRRLIDPGLWQSGHFKRLSLRQRLLWIGVITMADDDGKLKGEPAVLKAAIFPFDSVGLGVIEKDLRTLQGEGLIERYTVSGDLYIRIVKWAKYQKPSHPTPSKIPDPSPGAYSGVHPETLAKPSGETPDQSSSGEERVGERRKGEVPGEPIPNALNGNDEPGWLIPGKLRSTAFYFQQRQCGALKEPNKKIIGWMKEPVQLNGKELDAVLSSQYPGWKPGGGEG